MSKVKDATAKIPWARTNSIRRLVENYSVTITQLDSLPTRDRHTPKKRLTHPGVVIRSNAVNPNANLREE
jgi:hypothetical protein